MQRVTKAPVGPTGGSFTMGPAILASGYLAKRTRSLGRWKKRWWQLTDDGTLFYFKNEERTKVLGEIDIARSCYEVKFGADQCKVDFPGAVPACCCFSFSVLKRTYYLYAATAADAKRWAESIASVSVVLNYRKKRRPAPVMPQRPASTPCVRAENILPLSHHSTQEQERAREKRSNSSPGQRLPKVHASLSGDLTYTTVGSLAAEASDKHTELPRFAKQGRGKAAPYRGVGARSPSPASPGGNRYGSAPNLFFGTGLNHHPPKGKRPSPHNRQAVNSRLWLDGSPPPNSRTAAAVKRNRRKLAGPQGHYSVSQHPQHHLQHHRAGSGGSLDRMQVKKHRAPAHAGQQQLITTRWPVDMDGYELPPRPQSVDVTGFPQPQKRVPVPHARQHLRRLQIVPYVPSTPTTKKPLSSSLGDLTRIEPDAADPPPVKPKPILKKSRAVQSPESSTTSNTTLPESKVLPPEVPPKHLSMKMSVNSNGGQRNVFIPPPPNFKPPPPPELRSDSSSPSASSNTTTGKVGSASSIGASRATANPQRSTGYWYTDPNALLKQLTMEIKRIGMLQMDGSVCTTFRKLQKETQGIFPDLIGVLMLARRYKIVNFTGSTLIEGRDDGALITLHRDIR